jgi:glycolate oxidase FAD binding subunit
MSEATLAAPGTEAEIAAAVAAAHATREPLLVEGAGTKRGMLRPVQAARTLSTRNLSGITLHAPQELVLSAFAGTPVAEVEAKLAEAGQQLVAEPPDLSGLLGPKEDNGQATLGGVVAANLSGPRRIAWGAMRDHVVGVRFVNGTGEVLRSGGRVLKNVTGLDLCKLLAGSHGTLAVLTEITVKVLPAAKQVGTLALAGLDARQGVAALSAALGSPYGVSGAAWLPGEAAARAPELGGLAAGMPGGVALIRIEDFAPSVAYRLGRLRAELGGEVLDDAASRALWRRVRDADVLPAAPDDGVWRISVKPSSGPAVAAALEAAGARLFLDWGGGLAWIAGPAMVATHAAVRDAAQAHGGTWTMMRAPDSLRAAVDVVPPEAAALARITRRVKRALDPAGIFNPGRLYAGL